MDNTSAINKHSKAMKDLSPNFVIPGLMSLFHAIDVWLSKLTFKVIFDHLKR